MALTFTPGAYAVSFLSAANFAAHSIFLLLGWNCSRSSFWHASFDDDVWLENSRLLAGIVVFRYDCLQHSWSCCNYCWWGAECNHYFLFRFFFLWFDMKMQLVNAAKIGSFTGNATLPFVLLLVLYMPCVVLFSYTLSFLFGKNVENVTSMLPPVCSDSFSNFVFRYSYINISLHFCNFFVVVSFNGNNYLVNMNCCRFFLNFFG